MKTLVVLFAILAIALAINDAEWNAFKAKYKKSYATDDEEVYRYSVFQKNVKKAAERQAQELPGGATFGVTKFSDLTDKEFRAKYLMPTDNTRQYNPHPVADPPKVNPIYKPDPKNYNWFTQASPAVCTPIYNQGECGSCWAFSATETIETYYALAGNPITGLSMEQIVDCDSEAFGCGGGWPYWAYEYVMQTGGLDSYNSYPYTAEDGNSGTCNFTTKSVVTQLKGYQNISGETGLYATASTMGPVSVCVDASSWSAYTGGVLTTCTDYVDHCVQLVGYANYGQAFPNAYWIVRNSWGEDWGEDGFIWVAIGQDLCVIGDYATIVTVEDPGKK